MNRRLYVGNLAFTTTSDQLFELFSVHGEVVEANLITDRVSGRSKGFAFVEMTSDDGARKAIEALNDHDLDGRMIKVSIAKEREQRPSRTGYSSRR